MALQQWPPKWWGTVVNLGSDNAFFRQCIPRMDVYQWLYKTANEIIKIIPHQPPQYRRTVYGEVTAFTGELVPVPLGEVGYNAIRKEVLWGVNTQGGWTKEEATFPVQSMWPILYQLAIMIPWDIFGEIDQLIGAGADAAPATGDIGKWLFNGAQQSLKELGISMPAFPGGPWTGSSASIADITLRAGAYEIVTNKNITYTFNVPGDIRLAAAGTFGPVTIRAQQIGYDPAIADMGSELSISDWNGTQSYEKLKVKVSTQVPVKAKGVPADPDYAPAQPGNTILGEDPKNAETAVRWFRLTNNASSDITIAERAYNFSTPGMGYIIDLAGHGPTVIPAGASWEWYMQGAVPGFDQFFTSTGYMNMQASTPLLGDIPDMLYGEYFEGHGALVSNPGSNASTGTTGSTQIIIENTNAVGGQLIPSLQDLIFGNIPVMDLCQRFYTLVKEMVDAIYHHPLPFTKTVITDGVHVRYTYRIEDKDGNSETKYEKPGVGELQGKKLQVYGTFSDKYGVVEANKLLCEQEFFASEITVEKEKDWEDTDANLSIGEMVLIDTVPTIATIETIEEGHDDIPEEGAPGDPDYKPAEPKLPTVISLRFEYPPSPEPDAEKTEAIALAAVNPTAEIHGIPVICVASNWGEDNGLKVGTIKDAGSGLKVFLVKILSYGTLSKEPEEVGATTATPARISAVLFNDTGADVTIDDPLDFPQSFTLSTSNFTVSEGAPEPGAFPLTIPKKVDIAGARPVANKPPPKNPTATNKPLAAYEIAFSAVSPVIKWDMPKDLRMWLADDAMTYIGADFDFTEPFSGKPGVMAKRKLVCRIRYKNYIDKEAGLVDTVWTNTYGPDIKPPPGQVDAAQITYDAVKRAVTITNLIGKPGSITMRLNACIFFIMHHIFMFPVTII